MPTVPIAADPSTCRSVRAASAREFFRWFDDPWKHCTWVQGGLMGVRHRERWSVPLMSVGKRTGQTGKSIHHGYTTHKPPSVLLLRGRDCLRDGGSGGSAALAGKSDGDPRRHRTRPAELYVSPLPGGLRRGPLVARAGLCAPGRCAKTVDARLPCVHGRQRGLVHEAASSLGTSRGRRGRLGGHHRRAARLECPAGGVRRHRSCRRWCALEPASEQVSKNLDETHTKGV